jgi:hypothetical protein
MNFSMVSGLAEAKDLAVGKAANKFGVISFTRLSVHCADKIVAMSNS